MNEKHDWLVSSNVTSYRLESELVDELLRREERTEHIYVEDPRDISLTDEGKTIAGGFRLSEKAFSMLCKFLLNGLYPVCLGLSGIVQRARDSPDIFSWREMLLIYNTVVRRRYSMLIGYRLVVDLDTKVVCGLLGKNTKVLTNMRAWEILKDAVEDTDKVGFREAQLFDRRMVLYLSEDSPAFQTQVNDRVEDFYAGLRLVNSDGGDAAVRGSAILIRDLNNTYLGDRFLKRTSHAGRDFRQNLNKMMRNVNERKEVLKTYDSLFESLNATPLPIPGPGDARSAFVRRLVNRMVHTHVRRQLAQRIASVLVSRVMHSTEEDRFLIPPSVRQLSASSMLDLVFAASWVASQDNVCASDREYAEHWALYAAKNAELFVESTE